MITREQKNTVLKSWNHEDSYSYFKDLEDGTWIMGERLMFHWMVIRGTYDGILEGLPGMYFDRWCYDTEANAGAAVSLFPVNPPADYEPDGWHRHLGTHRRRPNGDKTQEYIGA